MAQNLFQGSTVPTPNDEDARERGMGQTRRMDEHLVVEKLILFSCLDQAIQQEDFSKGVVFKNLNFLEIRALAVQENP